MVDYETPVVSLLYNNHDRQGGLVGCLISLVQSSRTISVVAGSDPFRPCETPSLELEAHEILLWGEGRILKRCTCLTSPKFERAVYP